MLRQLNASWHTAAVDDELVLPPATMSCRVAAIDHPVGKSSAAAMVEQSDWLPATGRSAQPAVWPPATRSLIENKQERRPQQQGRAGTADGSAAQLHRPDRRPSGEGPRRHLQPVRARGGGQGRGLLRRRGSLREQPGRRGGVRGHGQDRRPQPQPRQLPPRLLAVGRLPAAGRVSAEPHERSYILTANNCIMCGCSSTTW
ncbi:hypothetical protein ZWY2020_054198 [Hordeum vulgare]|nr:hypothetical protein ZWY2020_054198 [Hordeum vulgare]